MSGMDMSGDTSHGSVVDAEAGGHGHSSSPGDRANWWVVGAFLGLIVSATTAAAGTKRRLARKMAAGELLGTGVRNV